MKVPDIVLVPETSKKHPTSHEDLHHQQDGPTNISARSNNRHHSPRGKGDIGAFGQAHDNIVTCLVPGCTAVIFKDGLCRVHHSVHFYDLAQGGRQHGGIDFGIDKCVVTGCGGDVYKKTLCLEHYSECERDLVDSVEIELHNKTNPWAKEDKEDPHKVAARLRKKAEQEKKDAEALEACKQAIAEREALEKLRRDRELEGSNKHLRGIEDAERKLKEEEEEMLRRKREKEEEQRAMMGRLKREAEARAVKELERQRKEREAKGQAARSLQDAQDEAEMEKERIRSELEMLRAQRDKELAKHRKEMREEKKQLKKRQEEEAERARREKEAESKLKEEEDGQERRAARLRKKEEERMKKEMEIRAATNLAYQESKAAQDKNRSGVYKTEVDKHLVREDCMTADGKGRFSAATTYAETHQEWQTSQEWESPFSGILAIDEENALVRSLGGFTSWEVKAEKVEKEPDNEGVRSSSTVSINAIVRTGKGRYYATAGSYIYQLNPSTGKIHSPVELTVDGHRVKLVKSLCTSQWLHQKHHEVVFGLVKHGSIPGVVGDTLCNIDLKTGECTTIFTTHRTDLVALAAPPLSGGPWNGVVFFYWSATGGLHSIHWANENYLEKTLGGGSGLTGVNSLTFSTAGQLYVIGEAICAIDPHTAAILSTVRLSIALKAAIWEPDQDGILKTPNSTGLLATPQSFPQSPADSKPGPKQFFSESKSGSIHSPSRVPGAK